MHEAVVVARPDGGASPSWWPYVVPAREAAPVIAELRRYVRGRLPQYMVPTRWLVLSALPLTPNGKVDRAALPAPGRAPSERDGPSVAPRNAIEARIAAIWTEVLKCGRVGVEDDFFDLGGDSLRAPG